MLDVAAIDCALWGRSGRGDVPPRPMSRMLWCLLVQRLFRACSHSLLLVTTLAAPLLAQHTYYVSISSGNDANTPAQAQQKWTPWARLPGMPGGPKYTPVAGDRFILKGCDVWTNRNFPVQWNWSGTNVAKQITIGVDPGWYNLANCPDAWNRPVFDAEDRAITGSNVFVLLRRGTQYVKIDNLEMRGFYWDSSSQAYGKCAYIVTAGTSYITISHLYAHRWRHHSSADGTRDRLSIILGDTNPPHVVGSVCDYCLVDGSDGDSDAGRAFMAFPSVTHSVIHDIPNAILLQGHGEVGHNHIYNITKSFDGTHENAIESTGGADGAYYIHDNVIHDLVYSAMSLFIGNPGETDYVWNNLIYNTVGTIYLEQLPGETAGSSAYIWNNTIAPANRGGGGLRPSNYYYCLRPGHTGASMQTVVFQNNYCISTAPSAVRPDVAAITLTLDHNVLQTPPASARQGYTSSAAYALLSGAASKATIGKGINLSGGCSGALAGLCADTSYACTVTPAKQIVCPARKAVLRPRNRAWDVGAFQRPE